MERTPVSDPKDSDPRVAPTGNCVAPQGSTASSGQGAKSSSVPEKLFIIYDERAMFEGTDEASVYCTASTLKEARRDVRTMFPRGVIYEYDRVDGQLINEHFIEGPKN